MTVLLVLFTLMLFLTVDYFIQKAHAAAARAVVIRPERVNSVMANGGLEFPNDIALAHNHTWMRKDHDGIATIGLDAFLGRLVGTMETILLPSVDAMVTPATNDITLSAQGKRLELASPLLGKVVDVNLNVLKNPSLARLDPYGAGWLLKVKPRTDGNNASNAFIVHHPAQWLKEQADQVKEFFAGYRTSGQLATMQDGGIPVDGLLQQFDAPVWKDFKETFVALHRTVKN